MKKIALGFAVATVLGLASMVAPAAAFPAPQLGATAKAVSPDVTPVYYRRYNRVCTVRTVVRYSHGRRIVSKVRTCR